MQLRRPLDELVQWVWIIIIRTQRCRPQQQGTLRCPLFAGSSATAEKAATREPRRREVKDNWSNWGGGHSFALSFAPSLACLLCTPCNQRSTTQANPHFISCSKQALRAVACGSEWRGGLGGTCDTNSNLCTVSHGVSQCLWPKPVKDVGFNAQNIASLRSSVANVPVSKQ